MSAFIAREYKSQLGYGGSRTNRLILNFKKSPLKEGTREWQYRAEAIKMFAREIEKLFKPKSTAAITAIPSSKPRAHPEYDNRFENLFQELLKTRPQLNIEWPVEIRKMIPSSHHGGTRDPDDIKRNYIWKGFKSSPERLGILDDVLTTGAYFRAMSDFLKDNGYKGQIIGIFWSRSNILSMPLRILDKNIITLKEHKLISFEGSRKTGKYKITERYKALKKFVK